MHSKKSLTLLAFAIFAAATLLFITGCGDKKHTEPAHAAQEQLYTCGMHPQVIQNKPGNCPICEMKLTPVRKAGGGSLAAGQSASNRTIKHYKSTMMPGEVSPTPRKDSMGMDMVPVYEDQAAQSSAITIDPVTIQNMDLRTALVGKGPLRKHVRTVGIVEFDETSVSEVTTKFRGWIVKLYVDATGQQVHRGEPLFEIYSPELYSAQVEYLLARKQSTNVAGAGQSLTDTALSKLKYLDVPDEQIAELERTGEARKSLRIDAPRDGIVVEKTVLEGQMAEPGMRLYRLADLSTVWVQSQVYEQDLPYVRLGQEATVSLSYLEDRKLRGRVTYVYPTVDEKTRTAKVRMEFHNPGYFLKPGMFANVELTAELSPSVLLVPDMAVLRSGERNTVFVALPEGKFDPRAVVLGPRAEGNMYQVLSGLSEGERIVTSGQFMLDSESQLREAIQKMVQPAQNAEQAAPAASPPAVATQTTAPQTNGSIVYICPMPEHVALEYDHPGKCSLCRMNLVPVTREMLAKVQPGERVDYYTCPMPEHSAVHENKPGKCPRCGMTLIPVMQAKPAPPQAQSAPASDAVPQKLYTCPMEEHAHIVSDKPGKCPECEMKLVETSKVDHGKLAEENWRKQRSESGAAAPSHKH